MPEIPRSLRRIRLSDWLVAGAVVAFTTVLSTWPLILSPRLVPIHQDPLFSSWRLYQWARNVFGPTTEGLFDGNIFHPANDVLLFSDAILLPAALGMPFIHLGVPPLFVYDALVWMSFLAAGLAMYALARDLSGHHVGALAAAAIYTGAPYRIAHVYHLELLWTCWIPLAILAARRVMEGHRRAPWWLAAFVAGQFFCCIYYGLFLLTVLPVIVGVAWLAAGRPPIPRGPIARTAAGMVVAGVAIGLYALPYQRARSSVGDRPLEELVGYGATAADYVRAPPANRWWGWTGENSGDEHRLSAGLAAYALAAPALLPPLTPWTVGLLAGGLLSAEASRGLGGFTYPLLRGVAPPYRGLRVPARFAVMVLAVVAALAAMGVARIERELGAPRWWPAVACALVALVVAETASAVAVRPWHTSPPFVYRWLGLQAPTVIAHLPLPRSHTLPGVEQEFQYFAQFHRHELVNGNSGYYPSTYIRLLEDVRRFPDGRSLVALRDAGVEFLIVHRQHYRPDVYAAIIEQLDVELDVVPVGAFHDEADETRVYKLQPAPESPR
jgi:hypothetical protein